MAQAQAGYTVAKQLNDQVSNGKDITDLTKLGMFKLARDTIDQEQRRGSQMAGQQPGQGAARLGPGHLR